MFTAKQILGKVAITVEKDYWNIYKSYDKLVIVERENDKTYISRKPVPPLINISNRDYWISISPSNGESEASINLVQRLGLDPTVAVSQKVITEAIEELNALIQDNKSLNSIYTIKKNVPLVYNEEEYYLTDEYFEKEDVYENGTLIRESGYADAKYNIMFNNARAVEAAIKYAYENGYSGVRFEKGDYCFTTERPASWASDHPSYVPHIIKVESISHFDIDFGGATFYLLLDSAYNSEYYPIRTSEGGYTSGLEYTFNQEGRLFAISNSQFVTIHNGHFVGDRCLRKWLTATYINSKNEEITVYEKKEEHTTGICIGAFCRFITLKDIEAEMFMGDGISWDIHYNMNGEYVQERPTLPRELSIDDAVDAYRGKYVYDKNGDIAYDEYANVDNCAVTDIIDLSMLYNNSNPVGTYKSFKDERIYHLLRGCRPFDNSLDSSINFLSNIYPEVDIITYNNEDNTPLRILEKVRYLENFKLLPNETRIRLQFHHEDSLYYTETDYNNGVEDIDDNKKKLVRRYDNEREAFYVRKAIRVTEGNSHDIVIDGCYIHDNHRGGYTGDGYNLTIRNCRFEKTYTYPINKTGGLPLYGEGDNNGTRYHIDMEDVPSSSVSLINNIFISHGNHEGVTAGSVSTLSCMRLYAENNKFKNSGLSIGYACDATLSNNIIDDFSIKRDRYNSGGTLVYKSDAGGGSLFKKRVIVLDNNIINIFDLNFAELRNTILKSTNNVYKAFRSSFSGNGTTMEEALKVSFVNDSVYFKYIPNNPSGSLPIYNQLINMYVPLQVFSNCIFYGLSDYHGLNETVLHHIGQNTAFCKADVSDNIFKNVVVSLEMCQYDVTIRDCQFINDCELSLKVPYSLNTINIYLKNIRGVVLKDIFSITPIPSVSDNFTQEQQNAASANASQATHNIVIEDARFNSKPTVYKALTPNNNITFKNCNFKYLKSDLTDTDKLFNIITGTYAPNVKLIDCESLDVPYLLLWTGGTFVKEEGKDKERIIRVNNDFNADFGFYYDIEEDSGNVTIALPIVSLNADPVYKGDFSIHKNKGVNIAIEPTGVDASDIPIKYVSISTPNAEADEESPEEHILEEGVLMDSVTNPEVLAICYAEHWCTNSAKMTIAEAELVTDIGIVFKGSTTITHFEELESFGISSIPNSAFEDCVNLKSIVIPSTLDTIGEKAFKSSGITNIAIPNSVRSIGANAFRGCTSLVTISIGTGITSIGDEVFRGCTSMTSMYIYATEPPTLTNINAFSQNTTLIYVDSEYVDRYKTATTWSSNVIKNKIRSIPVIPEFISTFKEIKSSDDCILNVVWDGISWYVTITKFSEYVDEETEETEEIEE